MTDVIATTPYGLLDTTTGQLKGAGHNNGVAPAIAPVAAGAGAGSAAAFGTTQAATDTVGQISLTTAGTPGTGIQATVVFGTPFSVPPVVILTPADAATAAVWISKAIIAVATAAGVGFSLSVTTALATGTYTFNYHIPSGQV